MVVEMGKKFLIKKFSAKLWLRPIQGVMLPALKVGYHQRDFFLRMEAPILDLYKALLRCMQPFSKAFLFPQTRDSKELQFLIIQNLLSVQTYPGGPVPFIHPQFICGGFRSGNMSCTSRLPRSAWVINCYRNILLRKCSLDFGGSSSEHLWTTLGGKAKWVTGVVSTYCGLPLLYLELPKRYSGS